MYGPGLQVPTQQIRKTVQLSVQKSISLSIQAEGISVG